MSGAMTNPFRFQEVLAAAFHFDTTETVDQVNERHDREDEEAEARAKTKRNRRGAVGASGRPTAAPAITKPIPKSSLAELHDLLGAAGQARSPEKDLVEG